MFYGYIVVVNPKPFTSSNCSTFVKTCNCRVHPTSKGQHTQLRTSHPVHSLTLNSNVRGTESTVIGPSHEFFHHFFSRSQAHRLTSSRSQARQIATLEKKPSILSSKFHLTSEFFKHFGHFTDNDFKVYVHHLPEHTPRRVAAYPKVTVHKANHVHASDHTGHEWVERRKQKRVILEELVELQPDLKFMASDGALEGDAWR